MKIESIETYPVAIPLNKPFKTALRTVTVAESIYVKVTCDDGTVGWGEAPPTHVITGESLFSIKETIEHILKPAILGMTLLERENVFHTLHKATVGNTSAKAAIDIALHDCFAQKCGLPLFQLLGGSSSSLETDYTVSVNSPEEMAEDAAEYIQNGFNVLKIKVGKNDIETDIARIQAIRNEIGSEATIRLDANQGWTAKEAIYAIRRMEELFLNVELVEQPVKAHDIEGLKQVTDNTNTLIMADESIFSPDDARRVLTTRSADLLNIKLMKAGGIHRAMQINKLAESFGVACMVGSMIETKLGVTAAAHFAASQRNITRVDFDAPLMLSKDLIDGGINYDGRHISFSEGAGLGIEHVYYEN
ncbi:mandelate racemase/muconate lactonizing enzyme family protein [Pontibacillus yanchengensis]|uniref:Dipeptide epimerase n=1 Tax=Pontibacillus yanchengensis Y32 TaxID=1385514 RepID=A0A0A2TZA9_9BACI|nr:dipeptide epimerase [Pontibacillus yanchengensis]KGP74610.1 L-alanine-DL-glutamate epimerase [Pontibacillus yanchengensis Y32]